MRSIKRGLQTALALGVLLPGLAFAAAEEERPAMAAFLDAGGSEKVVAGAPAQDAPAEHAVSATLAAGELEKYRGGAEAVSNSTLSTGVVNDTTAVNVATGWNTIQDGAFAHASGLPIVIQNSGANVLIQNSTIVNVQFK